MSIQPGTRVLFGDSGVGIVLADDSPGIPRDHRGKPPARADGVEYVYVLDMPPAPDGMIREDDRSPGGWMPTDWLQVIDHG